MSKSYRDQQADDAASFLSQNHGLSSKVQISIELRNLIKLDKRSLSDPFCIMYMRTGSEEDWTELGRTEIVANSQDPHFVKKINFVYRFEEIQTVKFAVYDADEGFESHDATLVNPEDGDFQGGVEVPVSRMVGVDGKGRWEAPLEGSRDKGYAPARGRKGAPAGPPTIVVTAEEVANVNALVKVQLRGEGLANKDGPLGKSDPFVRIHRLNEDGSWAPVFRTEVKHNTARALWDMVSSSVQQLANGDAFRPLRFEVLDWDGDGDHDLIGEAQASLNDLQEMVQRAAQTGAPAFLPVKEPAKADAPGYTDSGKLLIESFELVPQPSFLDYVNAGAEISFITAIDFTASNGDASATDSLHHIDPLGQQLNPYAQAIMSVGQVVEFYDSDKLFPVYGFGAKLAPGQPANHCFAANFDDRAPDHHPAPGIAGVLQTYYAAVARVVMSGPTLFQQIISQAAALARSTASQGKYYVLLILTDGIINDMQKTIDTLVAASELPLSVLMVGVGDADFENMHILDADQERLKSTGGKLAARDIVQFVEISKYQTNSRLADKHQLAKELLAEIPGQFLDYMKSKNMSPQQLGAMTRANQVRPQL